MIKFVLQLYFCCIVQENDRKKEEKDERKRKYNVTWNDEVLYLPPLLNLHYGFCIFTGYSLIFLLQFQVTPEEMEAYRMKKIHHDDPMKNFLH